MFRIKVPSLLLDTDILIDFFRGQQAAEALMTRLDPQHETLSISVITVAEPLAGMREDEQQPTENLLSLFEKIPISETIARSAGAILQWFRRSHSLGLGDALIAATALAANATLLTRNSRHYTLPPLKVIRPY